MLIDEALTEPAAAQETPPPARRSRAKAEESGVSGYSLAALVDGQPRIADLLPRRRFTLWLWFLVSGAMVGALATCHAQLATWKAQRASVDFTALDLSSRGSLGDWFGALALAWSAFTAVQIYLIRRHRSDDYRGRYRVWLWFAGAFMLASADVAVSLHSLLGTLIAQWVGSPQRGELAGAVLLSLFLGVFLGRLMWEVRASRGAAALTGVAALCYVGGALTVFERFVTVAAPWMDPTVTLAGHAFVLLAIGVFGRRIFLEAHGQLAPTPRKTRARKSAGTTDKAAPAEKPAEPKKRAVKSDLATAPQEGDSAKATVTASGDAIPKKAPAIIRQEPAKAPTEKAPAPAPTSAPVAKAPRKETIAVSDDDDEEDATDNLSKAERRKLRKQKKQGQRAA